MRFLNGYKIRFILTGLILVFIVAPALGEDIGAGATSITAAGPRLGEIFEVEVKLPNRNALDKLTRAGYNIGRVRGDIATIFATESEFERLKQTGYEYNEITQGPEPEGSKSRSSNRYHSYCILTYKLNCYAETYPDICRLITLGQSVNGRELWAVLISDNPDDEEDEPEFKYDATIHGNEPLGTEMCLYFIELLLTEYGTDERITNLVNETAIWVLPMLNPDGHTSNQRFNANGIDLNRDFPRPDDIQQNIYEGGPLQNEGRQPETQHVMNWAAQNSLVLSGTFHTGMLCVLYPYGYNEELLSMDTPTPDDLLFKEIARRYSVHNEPMWNNPFFPDGIGNIAAWYIAAGNTADWNYCYLGCNEVGIELSNRFRPYPNQIPGYWSDNSESMLSFLEAVHIGVRGIITDKASGEPLWAEVLVEGNSHPVFTDADVGDYHRMLLPGTYNLMFNVPGYMPRLVRDITVTEGQAARVDIEMISEQASPDFNEDGKVDIEDLEMLIEHWEQDAPSFDIAPLPDGDGIVNIEDLALLTEYWHEEIPEF